MKISRIIISDIDDGAAVRAAAPALAGTVSDILKSKLSGASCDIFANGEVPQDTDGNVLYVSPCVKDPLAAVAAAEKAVCSTDFTRNGVTVAKLVCENGGRASQAEADFDCIGTRSELRAYIEAFRIETLERLFDAGVEIPCFDGVEVSPLANIENGAVILSGTKIGAYSTVKAGAVIGPDSDIIESDVGAGCVIERTKISRSVLEDNVKIGPFSQVRPGCHIKSGVKVGDFVEIKNSVIGRDTHASHLTYIGDSDVGERVNFGCGTVTSNYDGKNKFRTVIGNDAFIGCNTNLVAPVKVGDFAYTAAGSTITKDVPDGALAVARERQTVINGWVEKRNKK